MKLRLKELREDLCISVKDMARDSGSNHEDFEEVGFEEIERRRPQNIRQRTF